jgi:drug/metabolite transporter (DMT)-like permease
MWRWCGLRQRERVRIGSVLVAAASFGAVSVLAKHAYASGSEPVPLLGARVLLAAVLLSLAVATAPGRPSRRDAGLLVVAGLAFGGAGLAEFQALSLAAVPTVVLLVFIAPAWIALGDWVFRRERLPRPQLAALAGLPAGFALLVAAPDGRSPDPVAIGCALVASILSAVFFVSLGRVEGSLRPRVAACAVAWIAAALVVPLDPGGVAGDLLRADANVAAIGAFTACGLVLVGTGLRGVRALTASAVICVEPVVAGVLSWLVLHEVMTRIQLAGGVVVLLSVALLSALSARAAPAPCATGRTRPPRPGSRPRPRPARTARPRRSEGRSRG